MTFPGGSKSKVKRAGSRVRKGTETPADMAVLEEWRGAHRRVLNTFQAILRGRTRGRQITVAQRHKRLATIIDKLKRLPNMSLSNMDDVAGCRVIFKSVPALRKFRQSLHRANFSHERKNDADKYDYIKSPKLSGYRGIHDVYSYDVNSASGERFKGLLVEIQYRTLIQHAWATAVEVIGHITDSDPKFDRGDERYLNAMSYASEILARHAEKLNGPHPDLTNIQLVRKFQAIDKKIELLDTLRDLNRVNVPFTKNKNTILVMNADGNLQVKSYRTAPSAMQTLFDFEKSGSEDDIVLVRGNTSEDIRLAFTNYFSDAREFVKLMERACLKLPKTPRTIKVQSKRR